MAIDTKDAPKESAKTTTPATESEQKERAPDVDAQAKGD
jgi:hypothetical protein